jgi:hypothetical protein
MVRFTPHYWQHFSVLQRSILRENRLAISLMREHSLEREHYVESHVPVCDRLETEREIGFDDQDTE